MNFIPSSKIKQGVLKCLKHSRRLISGANELDKQNEDANAVCLAILAQEEIGKGIFLLRHMKEGITEKEWEDISKTKNAHINKLREFREFVKRLPKKRHPYKIDAKLLQKIKEDGFYVDWKEKDNDWYFFDESELTTRVMLLELSFRLRDDAEEALLRLKEKVKNIE